MVRMNAEIGTPNRLEGMLRLSERGLLLEIDDSGVWALDAEPDDQCLAGRRIRVEGIRCGFDRIEVEWMGAA